MGLLKGVRPLARVALVLLLLATFISLKPQTRSAGAEGAGYTIRQLRTLGGLNSNAEAINASGQVVGSANTAAGDEHAFLWTPATPNGVSGTMVDLGTLGGPTSQAYGINSSGQVIGSANTAGLFDHAFLWTPTTPNGTSGTMVGPGGFGGLYSDAVAVNDSGQVVGYYKDANNSKHAFLWSPTSPNGTSGATVDLSSQVGADSAPGGINATGQVAGDGSVRAFLWTPTTPNGSSGATTDLGTLGGSFVAAAHVNELGQVVGVAGAPDGYAHAFLWAPSIPNGTSGAMVDLGTPNGADSYATAINDSGQIVVTVDTRDGHAHAELWTPGGTAAPVIASVSPTSGPTNGFTSIMISGSNFTGATAVSFSGIPASGFTVDSDTQITAVSPAHAAGTVDVTVTTPGGTSAASSQDQFTYVNTADLSLTMTGSPSWLTVGKPLAYSISVTNKGPNPATGVTVTDTLPSGATFGSATASQGSCNATSPADGLQVTCDIGALANASKATVNVSVTPQVGGAISNVAAVTANEIETDPSNNIATVNTNVATPGVLGISTSADVYKLPVPGGFKVYVVQGNNGSFSHYGNEAYAFDFAIDANDGTSQTFPVAAAKGGTVVALRSDSTDYSCSAVTKGLVCPNDVNFVLVEEGDGKTADLYLHFDPGTIQVQLHQSVRQGDILGMAGETGYAFGIHVHLQVQGFSTSVIPTFKDASGKAVSCAQVTSVNAVTGGCATRGWWYGQSQQIQFADWDVVNKTSGDASGIPQEDQSYVSGNAAPFRWVAPFNSQRIKGSTVTFTAKPKYPVSSWMSQIEFTVWWAAVGDKSGPWKVACIGNPSGQSPLANYTCQGNLGTSGSNALHAPTGTLWISFDVYLKNPANPTDPKSGAADLSPDGERTINHTN